MAEYPEHPGESHTFDRKIGNCSQSEIVVRTYLFSMLVIPVNKLQRLPSFVEDCLMNCRVDYIIILCCFVKVVRWQLNHISLFWVHCVVCPVLYYSINLSQCFNIRLIKNLITKLPIPRWKRDGRSQHKLTKTKLFTLSTNETTVIFLIWYRKVQTKFVGNPCFHRYHEPRLYDKYVKQTNITKM